MTVDYGELRKLQNQIGAANSEKGFHVQGNELREEMDAQLRYANLYGRDADVAQAEANLRNYYSMKLGLIVTEVAEAIEELRAGRHVDETWYSAQPTGENGIRAIAAKPEGVPSELADVVIRCFDFAAEAGIDLASVIEEKLAYNATRPFMHGGKKA